MASSSTIPREVKKEIIDSWHIASEPEWKVCLLTADFPYANDGSYVTYGDLTNEVPNGSGYTTEGEVVTRIAWAAYVDSVNAMIDADDVAWAGATFANVKYAVVYETTGGKIRAVYEFSEAKSVTSGTFTLQWNSGGLIKIS